MEYNGVMRVVEVALPPAPTAAVAAVDVSTTAGAVQSMETSDILELALSRLPVSSSFLGAELVRFD